MTKRELIFNAAAKLFAERSFNSVGIRDIAGEAGVNSAMISYYFGGKANLLREIFATFGDLIHDPYEQVSRQARDIYDLADKTVVALLKAAGENQDVFVVGLRELNSDSPELSDLRARVRDRGQETFSQTLVRLGLPDTMTEQQKEILHDAALGAIFSDLLLGGKKNFNSKTCNEEYVRIVSDMLKHGVAHILS